jgi:hypothetical protein
MAESAFKALGLALRQVVPVFASRLSPAFSNFVCEGGIERRGCGCSFNQGLAVGYLLHVLVVTSFRHGAVPINFQVSRHGLQQQGALAAKRQTRRPSFNSHLLVSENSHLQ